MSGLTALWTTRAVRAVRRVPSYEERVPARYTDTFERSSPEPALTYGANGRMGCGDVST
jgi:hypothetical protein